VQVNLSVIIQGGHKPGILSYFSEHGKLREFCATSGKNCNKQYFSLSFKYLCKTAVDWVNRIIRPLMKVFITFTFCCDDLWKSKSVALEKPGKLGIFVPYFVASLYLPSVITQKSYERILMKFLEE